LSLPKLIEAKGKSEIKTTSYETLQDQIVWRDLCFVVDSTSSFEAILKAIKDIKEISALEVFDAYEGKNLGEGKKSVSLKIKILGEGNLTTEQINEIMNKAIKAAEKAG
jgi:phenylalanyl-tRNA synthetase beta chain